MNEDVKIVTVDTYPLTREIMDHMTSGGCEIPDCDHNHEPDPVYIEPGCHPGDGCSVTHHRDMGVLHFLCATCGQPIVAFLLIPLEAIDMSKVAEHDQTIGSWSQG